MVDKVADDEQKQVPYLTLKFEDGEKANVESNIPNWEWLLLKVAAQIKAQI